MVLKEEDLLNNLGKIAYALDKAYISRLEDDYGVVPFDEVYNENDRISYSANIRALKVKSLVYNKEENELDCFKNVLTAFSNSENTVALVITRKQNTTEMYFVLKNEVEGGNEYSKANIELLKQSLDGNLPGSDFEIIDGAEQITMCDEIESISMLCSVPSEKSKEYTSQRIEKLLNGVVPKRKEEEYTIVILAESLRQHDIRELLSGYEEIATAIKPFSEHQFQMGTNETDTTGEMESLSDTKGTSHAETKTKNVNLALNAGKSHNIINSISKTKNGAGAIQAKGTAVGAVLGTAVGTIIPGVGNALGATLGAAIGTAAGSVLGLFVGSTTKTKSEAFGDNAGVSAGFGYSWGTTDTTNESKTKTKGINHSLSLGKSENTTYNYKSYTVSGMISKVEETIKRINESQANGLWNCASYVLTHDAKTGKNIANFLRSITQGEKSYIEPAIVQEWSYEESNGMTAFGEIKKYIKYYTHPIFANISDGTIVRAITNISTDELSKAMAFPKYSLQGIPVLECTEFGRNVIKTDKTESDEGNTIDIGKIYHMRKDEDTKVSLAINTLASHTFVTGSTGAGKSNAIYQIIDKLKDNNKKFLIIEPAKGEYKKVFGGWDNVHVYGTNPKKAQLLKINPFSFIDDIHVLEHIDRLVEIFNACWPMYAAMPAVLKDSIERIYINKGWDLSYSVCEPKVFPTLYDLLEVLPQVMKESEYSSDTKSDYSGALITRVKSLTNGINGQIFCTSEDPEKESKKLFENNVIVDISRIGSMETKSLIMGMLIMKLQEYHMSSEKINEDLQHVTVLEEAHNLLRRTSSVQSQESSNLQGKSVEMISNAIAEMRTYGEGFIIADQAPGLLDESVIRNTNTKIIFRLPDEEDRILAGRSEALTDNQISELAKLPRGVAAVYQNNWAEAVLCYFEKFDKNKIKPYKNKDNPEQGNTYKQYTTYLKDYFYNLFGISDRKELSQEAVDFIRNWKDNLIVNDKTKSLLTKAINGEILNAKECQCVAYNVFKGKPLTFILQNNSDIQQGVENMTKSIENMFNIHDESLAIVIRDLTFKTMSENIENSSLLKRYEPYIERGKIR